MYEMKYPVTLQLIQQWELDCVEHINNESQSAKIHALFKGFKFENFIP